MTTNIFTKAQSYSDLIIKANVEIETKQYLNAIEYLNKAIQIKSDYTDLYLKRANCNYQLLNYNTALTDFLKADSLNPNCASFYIACCYAQLNKNDDALVYLKINLQSRYKEPQRIYKTEKAFINLEKTSLWKEIWKEDWFTSFENDFSEAEYYYEKKKKEKALDIVNNLMIKHNNNFNLIHLRGKIFISLGDYDHALSDLNEAISRKSYEPVLYKERGTIYKKTNKFHKALQDFNKAYELDQFDLSIVKEIAYTEWKLKLYDKSADNFKEYLSFYSSDKEAIFDCGLMYYEKQDYLGALPYFNQIMEKEKGKIKYFVARGNTYLACKSYIFSEQDFTQALDLNPNESIIYLNRGIARFEQGNKAGACRDWQKAFDLKNPDSREYLDKNCTQK